MYNLNYTPTTSEYIVEEKLYLGYANKKGWIPRQVLGSNLGRDTDRPESCRGIPQSSGQVPGQYID
jgi:hypothetical protein